MMSLSTILVMLIPLLGWASPMQFNTPTTNNSVATWPAWTNGVPLRYSLYWVATNTPDAGTNWAATCSWASFADVNSSTTRSSMRNVPTNTWVTMVVTAVGGNQTTACLSNGLPYLYRGYPGITITNQPVAP